jgi:hypothetical protein
VSKRRVLVVLLTEDKQQQVFTRRFLQGLGYDPRKLRVLPIPQGQGSGEQYVRERYASEVRNLRSGQFQQALVVVLDADTGEVADRTRQLAAELNAAGLEPRADDERIVHLIPRRNIETWIAYLRGEQVNEKDKYQRLKRERDCQPAVDRLVELYRSNQPLPVGCPSSLKTALEELHRLGQESPAQSESQKKGRKPRRKRG